jgi:hypothetical protein
MNDSFDVQPDPPGFGPPPLAPAPTSRKAVASLVLGILAPFTCALTSIPGVVFGVLAMVDLNRSGARLRGAGMAIAGLILSSLSLILAPAMLLPAIVNVRRTQQSIQSQVNLKNIALAAFAYSTGRGGQLPPAATRSEDGEPLHSWRTLILPYLENQALYETIDLNAPWDDARNEEATGVPLPIYQRPEGFEVIEARTNYFAVVGEGFAFNENSPTLLQDVYDGLSTTILFVEYPPSSTRWAEPEDLTFDEYAEYVLEGAAPSSRGFMVAMVDGSVRFLPRDITREELHALFTVRGGELTEEATLAR